MNIKSLSKSQYNSEFLGGMLEKHKNLIQMLDKRSRYSTFQNWFFFIIVDKFKPYDY